MGAGFVTGFTAAATGDGLVCLRGFVFFVPDRKVSEIFDWDDERAAVGAIVLYGTAVMTLMRTVVCSVSVRIFVWKVTCRVCPLAG